MKTILITGASGNLGTEAIKSLHRQGLRVCATTGSVPLTEAVAPLVANAQKVDLTNEQAVQAYIENLAVEYPDLAGAVLLVGGFAAGDLHTTDGAAIDKQIALNFKTAYFVVRSLITHFEARGGGQFVLIGARPALDPEAGKDLVAYALSKALVMHLAKLINAFGYGKGIHATVLVPSTIDTPANRQAMPDADASRWVKSEDIAETIGFVLSDTGSVLRDSILKVYNEA